MSVETTNPILPSSSSTDSPSLLALKKLDSLSSSYSSSGKLLESLNCMEKSLILRGHLFGVDSAEVYRACKSVAEMCNYLAMTYLQAEQYQITLELLKKAEILTEKHQIVRAVTYNNFACYYRKKLKLRTALNYCNKALQIEAKLSNSVKSADTHLNICTILSELKRHDKAAIHAKIALKLLLIELFGDFDHPSVESSSPISSDRIAVLSIAYHNLGVQQEFLHNYADSLASYDKACRVVETHLGQSHPLYKSLYDSFQTANKKFADKLKSFNNNNTNYIKQKGNNTNKIAIGSGYDSSSAAAEKDKK